MVWTTWWLWRGAYTRSHPELGREKPQRPWYCVLRHGRVGRRQVFQTIQHNTKLKPRILPGQVPDLPGQDAGWSSPVARQAHNLKVTGSNPVPATNFARHLNRLAGVLILRLNSDSLRGSKRARNRAKRLESPVSRSFKRSIA